MSLLPYIQIVARGKNKGRPLSCEEAEMAMDLILSGTALTEQVSAFLMVLRMRGETPEEIAGFTRSFRNVTQVLHGQFDLDWPCYAAGRTRGAPLFLLSAKLVAHAGYTVMLHGWNSHQTPIADVRSALGPLGISTGQPDASISYFPLENLSSRGLSLLRLRETLGLRSCINTVLRMWNPSNARSSVQGVFHPSYRGLQSLVAEILGTNAVTVIKGGSGEFERNPAKAIQIFGYRNASLLDETAPSLLPDVTRKLNDITQNVSPIDLWFGRSADPFATSVVTGTAAIALWSVGATENIPQAESLATDLWENRFDNERACA